MRVANKSVFDAAKYDLANINYQLNRANRIVSSGKRINDLSDDPVGLTQAMNIRAALESIDQAGRNISFGQSWLYSTESALNQAKEIVSDLKALSVQMANSTIGFDQRFSAALDVQSMMEEIISIANTDVNGRYVFGGTKTGTSPFDQNANYNGNASAFTIKIGRDATMAVGSVGSAVFGALFTTLSNFQTALKDNNVNGIEQVMGELDTHFDTLSAKISEVGSKTLRLEVKEKILQDLDITNTDRLANIEDADIAEAVMNLKTIEFSYQATLASSAKVITMSLVDYLT